MEYTDAFIIVNKNESGKNIEDSAYLYWYGIYESVDGGRYIKYVEYKRSGNAAKRGKHIFIREDFFDEMMKWTWLGFSPKKLEKLSLPYVEMKAYEALVNSNIKGIVNIHPDEILLLGDRKNTFRSRVAVVREEKGNFSIQRCEADVTNNLFDGECLLDNSVFEAAGMDAGMMLLRNFFFKSCGFRTDIQGYYREYYGDAYETAQIRDYCYRQIDVKKIKMIVTVSSFKLFKFTSFFASAYFQQGIGAGAAPVSNGTMEELNEYFDERWQSDPAYTLWRRCVEENGCAFGVVKNEEVHREKRKFTYQMLNSMPFSENDIRELLSEDIEKFVELRTNPDCYEAYIAGGRERDAKEDPSYTEQFIVDLARKNPAFRQTKLYKEKRSNDLRAFKQKLYEGKLSIRADYYTLCSMPWELLQYSVTPEERYEEALNGADFDSDEVLGIRNEIVLRRALELSENEMVSAVPHADISADKRGVVGMENFKQQYKIDNSLLGNKIGLISNYTQILNSYYWDSLREDSIFASRQQELYDDIQILAVLMGLEIDKAKRAYSFEAEKVAKSILDKYSGCGENGRKRRNRPIFMRYIDERRHGEAAQKAAQGLWLDCPMDYLAKKLYGLYDTEEDISQTKLWGSEK